MAGAAAEREARTRQAEAAAERARAEGLAAAKAEVEQWLQAAVAQGREGVRAARETGARARREWEGRLAASEALRTEAQARVAAVEMEMAAVKGELEGLQATTAVAPPLLSLLASGEAADPLQKRVAELELQLEVEVRRHFFFENPFHTCTCTHAF